MTTTEKNREADANPAQSRGVDVKLEVVVIPVSDVDRAKAFYANLGWRLDADFASGDGWRIIQFTPLGSSCSVIFGKNVTAAAPGSARGLYPSPISKRCERICSPAVLRSAHGEHEKRTDGHDENWSDRYADYIVREQAGQPLPA